MAIYLSRSLYWITILLGLNLLAIPAYCSYNATNLIVSCDRWPDCSSLERFGNDCVRIAGAKTNEEKAIAVWRFIQQCTEAGSVPKEPAYENYYILSPLKLLNVYGVHWCDGLSRIMEMTWRELGYRAEKLYKFGHTLADCWWEDQDGIARWHVFDLSQHWFVYDRTGSHIATKDELALDHSLMYFPSRTPIPSNPSLMQPSHVHAGHLNILSHKTGIDLRQGESIRFLWGNEGKPYYNLFGKKLREDFEHGPYPITYGNGRLAYTPDLSRNDFLSSGCQESVNLACSESDGRTPALHPLEVKKPGSVVFKIALPYVISNAWLDARVKRETEESMIVFSISIDDGKSWQPIWQTEKERGIIDLERVPFCDRFDPAEGKRPEKITPFGRYNYLMRIELKAGSDISDCGIERFTITTVFQHNLFSLPLFWPGPNRITVAGELDAQSRLRIAYRWGDSKEKNREHTIEISDLPFQYEVVTEGKKWEEVVCQSLQISLLPASEENKVPSGMSYPGAQSSETPEQDLYPIEKSIGTYYPKALESAGHYIRNVRKLLEIQDQAGEKEATKLKALSKEIGRSVLALAALRAPEAREALEQVIKSDRTHPSQNKIWASQALYQSVGKKCVPLMMQILERDPGIAWYDRDQKRSKDAMWIQTVSIAAAILAEIRQFEESDQAADLIANILEKKRTRANRKHLGRGEEISWGLIKALGKLGSSKHVPLLKKFLAEGSDATAVAVLALEDIGDPSIIPDLLYLLNHFQYPPVGLYTIEALGELGSKDLGSSLYPFLDHGDEDFRGAAALALGKMGDTKAIPKLHELLEKEHFPWVIAATKQSLHGLENAHKDLGEASPE